MGFANKVLGAIACGLLGFFAFVHAAEQGGNSREGLKKFTEKYGKVIEELKTKVTEKSEDKELSELEAGIKATLISPEGFIKRLEELSKIMAKAKDDEFFEQLENVGFVIEEGDERVDQLIGFDAKKTAFNVATALGALYQAVKARGDAVGKVVEEDQVVIPLPAQKPAHTQKEIIDLFKAVVASADRAKDPLRKAFPRQLTTTFPAWKAYDKEILPQAKEALKMVETDTLKNKETVIKKLDVILEKCAFIGKEAWDRMKAGKIFGSVHDPASQSVIDIKSAVNAAKDALVEFKGE